MLRCKIASESLCGKVCCCHECPEINTCEDICPNYNGTNPVGECRECIQQPDYETDMVTLDKVTAPAIIQKITDMVIQQKRMEESITTMREQIRLAMEQYGIKSFENELIKMTYIAPTERKSVDTTKLKKEHPEIAEAYQKVSKVKSTIKIEVK